MRAIELDVVQLEQLAGCLYCLFTVSDWYVCNLTTVAIKDIDDGSEFGCACGQWEGALPHLQAAIASASERGQVVWPTGFGKNEVQREQLEALLQRVGLRLPPIIPVPAKLQRIEEVAIVAGMANRGGADWIQILYTMGGNVRKLCSHGEQVFMFS
ncbi:hypothetical protein COV04_01280 [Candidatus Uhrbacteria bacterium CG10_big_fil_rev_8_21_14_0_10_48_11]|uniref:Uncharacterized protein n=1 Tax=Candidatus Uhrbacteria bacterium CG10_big_fil_rev_8_21_14_0_10_48_11 TaxID=1975037 RepID=A0A2M8LFD3_9BACT|nr:MAG: hypothetical protein COV04_01280 [Candidatus Uhrbacteria bacterium CG10_big_fil_rev_8_21_14_0_10_48_11]